MGFKGFLSDSPRFRHQMGDPLARSFASQSLQLAEESGSARREASALRALVRAA